MMTKVHDKRDRCRTCGAPELISVADFGPQPLAGYYPETIEKSRHHDSYRLVLDGCPVCGLLQVTDLPPIDDVFHAGYTYSSSQVAPLVRHFVEYGDWIADRFSVDSKILEFGCNDGVLLNELRLRGFNYLYGVDASDNIVQAARKRGFDVQLGFFGLDMAKSFGEDGSFDFITCSNVFAHIDNLKDVFAGVHLLLKEEAEFCIEVHDAEKLIEEGQFETIYHEHLTYFSAATLSTCLQQNGFEVVEVVKTAMHGGGLRVRARKSARPAVVATISHDAAFFAHTGDILLDRVALCRRQVQDLYDTHGLLDGYGIAGRAQMFLAITGTARYFGSLFDDAAIRQGRYHVGTDLLIQPYAPGKAARACVILAWNYADAIAPKIAADYDAVYVLFPAFARLK